MIRNLTILLLLSLSFGTVTDIDGNVYETVQIGDQLWMAENLKVTHYNNEDEITHIINDEDWGSYDEGQYGVYDNDPANAEVYGNLYNWAVVNDDRGVCPTGFHVPSDSALKVLEMELGMSEEDANSTSWRGTDEGSKLAGNNDLWDNDDLENNSEFGTSGFSAFPAGDRNDGNGFYISMGFYGDFWSSSELSSNYAWYRSLSYYSSNVNRSNYDKRIGFSIRCLQD